jgi:hypothetical protein
MSIKVSQDDWGIILLAACSLDEHPNSSNWVEDAGSLPDYICRIARALKRSGKSTSTAIAIAVSRCKAWAAGGGNVNADTRAKAVKSIAAWEALKAKAKADNVKASHQHTHDVIFLSASYDTGIIREAWSIKNREKRDAWQAANPGRDIYSSDGYSSYYAQEIWSDFIIVSNDNEKYKVSYSVNTSGPTVGAEDVTFGTPVEVTVQYVEVPTDVDTNSLDKMAMSLALMAGDCKDMSNDEISGLVKLANGKSDSTDLVELTRKVKTPAGVSRFKRPIGSPIYDRGMDVKVQTGPHSVLPETKARFNYDPNKKKDATNRAAVQALVEQLTRQVRDDKKGGGGPAAVPHGASAKIIKSLNLQSDTVLGQLAIFLSKQLKQTYNTTGTFLLRKILAAVKAEQSKRK